MPTLDSGLRNALDTTIGKARDEAERAAIRALTTLTVNQDDAFARLSPEDRALRNQLRAKGRQLGDRKRLDDRAPLSREWALVRECAYEQWHRMLFARFLAENGLLIHPEAQVPLSLEDCAQLAAEEGIADPWLLVTDYAARMLPGIFRADDPLLRVTLLAEGRQALERLLESIPRAVFISEDGLGWTYQFWQTKRKKEVDASGNKIGGPDIAPKTQLFTEPYMVQFLLHNTLGAWWAAHYPDDPLVAELTYLRRLDDGTPAAGTFDGWPQRAADVTVIDPCCGSGHFLVAAFDLLRRMREREEGLTTAEACVAVLRDNINGLEIDARCAQIAAFALVHAAWKAGGYQELSVPNVACSGIPVGDRRYEWTDLAEGDSKLATNLNHLFDLFRLAPDLGSLIDPASETDLPMLAGDSAKLAQTLRKIIHQDKHANGLITGVFGEAALGVTRALTLLSAKYTLVATNVPYLARGNQGKNLFDFCEHRFPESKANLATVFVERCRAFSERGGTYALVTPQNWLFLGRYAHLRRRILSEQSCHNFIRLGHGAFETISGEVVNVALCIVSELAPGTLQEVTNLDVSKQSTPAKKATALRHDALIPILQRTMLANPDQRIALSTYADKATLLKKYADALGGITTGDAPRFRRFFWEIPELRSGWELQQLASSKTVPFGGREHILFWENGAGELARAASEGRATIAGRGAWARRGIVVQYTGSLPVTLYTGEFFENVCAVIVPREPETLKAIWAYCQSTEFNRDVRNIDKKFGVTCNTLAKVPFDLAHWQAIADAADPLPEPYSDDPTQWLFHGHPVRSTAPLQVAIARLLGYRWLQNEEDGLRRFADGDGIICLPPVAGEPPAADRLRTLLAAAYGEAWSPAMLERLIAQVGFGGKGLDTWLRDSAGFFKQHCTLFHNRPFLWQIWDGQRDGFSAIVNYHDLDGRKLERLIYTYLGSWITQQEEDVLANVIGADARLKAAKALQNKLVAIREGEADLDSKSGFDIYVRWKPLAKQPLGWEPDLNDGVRLNIRPFVTAEVLRAKLTVNWGKDRGRNLDGSERLNDLHITRAQKEAARRPGAHGRAPRWGRPCLMHCLGHCARRRSTTSTSRRRPPRSSGPMATATGRRCCRVCARLPRTTRPC